MQGVLEEFSKEVEADFKATKPTANLLKIKQEQMETESYSINSEQKKHFIDHIEQQTLNQTILKIGSKGALTKWTKFANMF